MKTVKDKIRSMYQAGGQVILNGVGNAEQAPLLAGLFNPNQNLAQFFNTLFKTAIVVGAMLAVLRLGYAGFLYMTSDLPGAKSGAKGIIGQTVTGLLLLLAVWLILNQINPDILNLDILRSIPQAGA